MRSFLQNLALLAVLALLLFIIFPDIMKQVIGVYNGLAILPIVILLIIMRALPRKRRRRRTKNAE